MCITTKSEIIAFNNFVQDPSLLFEFQTETVKLLVYNFAIVLLIANQDVGWNYKFNGIQWFNSQQANLKIAYLCKTNNL